MRNRHQIVLMVILGGAMAALLGGCCTLGIGTCTQTDTITLVSSNQLNACSGDNRSHPVAVRFFPLKDREKFLNSNFEDIWADPTGVLGGDLVGGYQEVFLAPGSRIDTPMVRPAGVTAVGMLINYCEEKDINSRRHLFDLGDKGIAKTAQLSGLNFSVE
jgi:type VI secretion system VasD/TssJ family lipoprotein